MRARRGSRCHCRIVSSDKDLMQLIRPGVTLYDTMKDRDVGEDAVLEKFGVTPDKVIDVQSLAGDSVDNVPGVPGIGVKTAAQLLSEYGDLETLLARAPEIKQQKRRENLIQFADQARISKRLVTLDDKVPVEHDVGDFAVDPPKASQLIGFLKALEFTSFTKKVAGELEADMAAIEPAPVEILFWPPEGGESVPEDEKTEARRGRRAAPPSPRPQRRAIGQRRCAEGHCLPSCGLRDGDRSGIARTLDRGGKQPGLSRRRHRDRCAGFDASQSGGRVAGDAPRQGLLHPAGPQAAGGGLFGGDAVPGQIEVKAALARLKPLLEDPACAEDRAEPEIRHRGVGAEWHRGGTHRRHHADLLCAGIGRCGPWHGRALRAHLGHKPISFKEVAGSGKSAVSFDRVELRRATDYAAEDARRDAAALAAAQAAAGGDGQAHRLRDA